MSRIILAIVLISMPVFMTIHETRAAEYAMAETKARRDRRKASAPTELAGSYCEVKKTDVRIARTEDEWNQLIVEMGMSVSEPPLRNIDFTTKMVAAAFMGEKPTSGYFIRISSAEVRKRNHRQTLVIKVWQEAPSADAVVAQVITRPFFLKVIPAFKGPIVVEDAN